MKRIPLYLSLALVLAMWPGAVRAQYGYRGGWGVGYGYGGWSWGSYYRPYYGGVGISVGLVALGEGDTADVLTARADAAMLEVKAAHHSRSHVPG